jgi:hypothetical protein
MREHFVVTEAVVLMIAISITVQACRSLGSGSGTEPTRHLAALESK